MMRRETEIDHQNNNAGSSSFRAREYRVSGNH